MQTGSKGEEWLIGAIQAGKVSPENPPFWGLCPPSSKGSAAGAAMIDGMVILCKEQCISMPKEYKRTYKYVHLLKAGLLFLACSRKRQFLMMYPNL